MSNPPKNDSGVGRRPRPRLRAVEPGGETADPGAALAPPSEIPPEIPPGVRAEALAGAGAPADDHPAPAAPTDPPARPPHRRKRRRAAPGRRRAATAPEPEVRPARMRARHWTVLASLVLLVGLPFAAAVGYLWTRAADQYHSEVAFSIRSEEVASATAGLLGALTQIGSGTASETDILNDYIHSQRIVEEIDAELDLRAIYNRPEGDPVFTLGADRSIEALHAHWQRMVEVAYDSNAGIIHVRANAFVPGEATAIAAAILERSGALVNRLSEQAREDAIRFGRDELAEAEAALRTIRQRLADFRRTHNIVDPTADVAGQMGLLSALQAELAQALVDRDVLSGYAGDDDQRIVQANRRIAAITARIEEERTSLDLTGVAGSLPEVMGTYEELLVDLEFANTAYTQALAGLAAARAEARRQSRYLAPHVQPTLAESSLYPRRWLIAGLAGLFLVLGWSVLILVYYNARDNR